MKDKVLSVLSAVVSFVKANKKVAIGVLVALLVIILVIVIASNGGKPSKYQEKIKTVTKAIGSESKMKKTFGDVIDTRAAAAWEEVGQDVEDFKKEYKKIKKNSDEVGDMEKALKHWAETNEKQGYDGRAKNIKEPKKSSKNNNIYTVSATVVTEMEYGNETEVSVKFVFYKGKIIDIINKDTDTSYFKQALKNYKSDKKSDTSSDDD